MRKPATISEPAPTGANILVLARKHFSAWLVPALLALVTIALYWPATHHNFVLFDDDAYVTSNVRVQAGLTLENIKWAFFNPVCSNWHPLTMMSHMLDCEIFGLQPWGHHLISILLHGINTALVFLLLRSMTGALWRSVLVAALFGWHPLHVESVAWVAERKDVLSTCFGLLALLFYIRYARARTENERRQETGILSPPFSVFTSGSYWLVFFFYLLGLLSKPMLVTWPFVMLLLDYWPLGRIANYKSLLALLAEKIPFFALAVMASVATFMAQNQEGAVVAAEDLPLGARCGNALISYWRYLAKLFWPADLAVFYPHPGYWPLGWVLLAGVLIVGISVLFFVKRQRYPFLLMGWLWYCGTLVPVIGLVQVGEQAMADRYSYIPSLGVFILTIWGLYEMAKRWDGHVYALAAAFSAAVVLCLLTQAQIGYWQDSETLFRHALEVTENNHNAHANLGIALANKGQFDEAIFQHQESIRLKPQEARYYGNLGVSFANKGQLDEAISQYREAIHLRPDFAGAYNNLGSALDAKGQTDEAIHAYQQAIRLKPDFAGVYYNLGNSFAGKGQTDEAIRQYRKAIHYEPNYAQAYNNLGIALTDKGQLDEAISQIRKAIRLHPDYIEAYNNLGITLARNGQIDEAIRQLQEALRIKPDYPDAINNLARVLSMKNAPAGR